MFDRIGFSYVGLIFLLMMWIPNSLWARHKPEGYDPSGENKALQAIERAGQALCTAAILLFSDTNPRGFEAWTAWFILSALLMLLYECYWFRYFRGGHTLRDFYRPFLGIPLPGAVLPVAVFLLLGIYGRVIWLILASIVLGIGHIGIHMQHYGRYRKGKNV